MMGHSDSCLTLTGYWTVPGYLLLLVKRVGVLGARMASIGNKPNTKSRPEIAVYGGKCTSHFMAWLWFTSLFLWVSVSGRIARSYTSLGNTYQFHRLWLASRWSPLSPCWPAPMSEYIVRLDFMMSELIEFVALESSDRGILTWALSAATSTGWILIGYIR